MRGTLAGCTVAGCLLAFACTSSGRSSDEWSRSYLVPREKVFETVLEVLEDEGYYVEVDAESGLIEAEPEAAARARKPVLAVRVAVKANRTVVDVQTRSGASPDQMVSLRTDAAVLEFLHALDRRLQGIGGDRRPPSAAVGGS